MVRWLSPVLSVMEGILLAEAVAAFLDDLLLEGKSPHTIRSYALHLKSLPGGAVTAFTPQVGRDTIRGSLGRLSLSSVRIRHAALSAFGSYCVQMGYLPQNPMRDVPRPKAKERPHTYLTEKQIQAIWQAAQSSPRKHAELELIVLLLMEGLRANEVCSLRWQDIREDRIVIAFGKGGKVRAVPLRPLVASRLAARKRTGERIFAFSPTALWSRMQRLGQRAGIRLHPHLMRHSWATLTLMAGLDSRHLQTLGGWSKPEMVERYARSALEEAALTKARDVALDLFG